MFEIRQLKTHITGSRGKSVPLLIVTHISKCDIDYLNEYYTSEHNKEESAHFAVSRTGDIYQYADIKERTFHAALPKDAHKDSRVQMVRNTKTLNPNYYSIGIVFEGYKEHGGDGKLTNEQYWAGVWLIRWLREQVIEKYGRYISLDRKHVVGHADIDPLRQADCPGASFPFDRMLKDLETLQKMPMPEFELRFNYFRDNEDMLSGINSALYKLNEYRNAYMRNGRWHEWGKEMIKRSVNALEKEGVL